MEFVKLEMLPIQCGRPKFKDNNYSMFNDSANNQTNNKTIKNKERQ